jgi:hypothetical protein
MSMICRRLGHDDALTDPSDAGVDRTAVEVQAEIEQVVVKYAADRLFLCWRMGGRDCTRDLPPGVRGVRGGFGRTEPSGCRRELMRMRSYSLRRVYTRSDEAARLLSRK